MPPEDGIVYTIVRGIVRTAVYPCYIQSCRIALTEMLTNFIKCLLFKAQICSEKEGLWKREKSHNCK